MLWFISMARSPTRDPLPWRLLALGLTYEGHREVTEEEMRESLNRWPPGLEPHVKWLKSA